MTAKIRIGIGGWTFAPWRGAFYPTDVPQKRELEYASRQLTSIEINGTYYGSQKPETFAKWHDETPETFVFTVKGPRFTTNRRVLAQAGESVERFFNGGVLELKQKLGPVNWQFMKTKKFDPEDFDAFLNLLPKSIGGQTIRHAVEVRHESFDTPAFMKLAKAHGVAVVLAGDCEFPSIEAASAPFVYARIMGTTPDEPNGYPNAAINAWAKRARAWQKAGRDVFLYVISGAKERNPAAALALLARLEKSAKTTAD